eukprot:scaffold54853_cov58-Phaeocystis_antarctica.AAC.2
MPTKIPSGARSTFSFASFCSAVSCETSPNSDHRQVRRTRPMRASSMQCEEWLVRQGGEVSTFLHAGFSGPRDERSSGQRCQPCVSMPSRKWNCMRTDESPMRTSQRSCSKSRNCAPTNGCDAVCCADPESSHAGFRDSQNAHALHLHCAQCALW